jgi:hypothetical protein
MQDPDMETDIHNAIQAADKVLTRMRKNSMRLKSTTVVKETRLMMPFNLIGPGRHFGELAL